VFSENPYFSNSVLTKEYKLREGPDPESPLDYDGPEIIRHLSLYYYLVKIKRNDSLPQTLIF